MTSHGQAPFPRWGRAEGGKEEDLGGKLVAPGSGLRKLVLANPIPPMLVPHPLGGHEVPNPGGPLCPLGTGLSGFLCLGYFILFL